MRKEEGGGEQVVQVGVLVGWREEQCQYGGGMVGVWLAEFQEDRTAARSEGYRFESSEHLKLSWGLEIKGTAR